MDGKWHLLDHYPTITEKDGFYAKGIIPLVDHVNGEVPLNTMWYCY